MNQYPEFEVQLEKGILENMHFHSGIELIYIIGNHAEIIVKEEKYQVNKEDIMLINTGVPHKIICQEETLVCLIRYPEQLLREQSDKQYVCFQGDKMEAGAPGHEELRYIIQSLIFHKVRGGKSH